MCVQIVPTYEDASRSEFKKKKPNNLEIFNGLSPQRSYEKRRKRKQTKREIKKITIYIYIILINHYGNGLL